MAGESTTTIAASGKPWKGRRERPRSRDALALAVAWSIDEPERVGEVALLPTSEPPLVLGRGAAREGDARGRVRFYRQRPGSLEARPALGGRGISREQLAVRATAGALEIERVGRCPMLVNGALADRAMVRPGDTLLLQNQLLLLCVDRPEQLPTLRGEAFERLHPFGAPDLHGLVGESPAIWSFRERAAFTGASDAHALVLGPSGVGKELAARAVHGWSPRAARSLVSRSAATLPDGLIDAELFGNVRDYPNPGMPERAGLIGDADRSTLFLDEIGELPPGLQAHLLRVLDAGGEYQRLGSSRTRRSDLRFIGATNRPVESLKHDLAARLTLRLAVPGLDARREDIPLLAGHLLRRAAGRSPEVAARYFEEDGRPRLGPLLVERLLRHCWTTHVRELDRLLWQAMAESEEAYIALTPGVEAEIRIPEPDGGEEPGHEAVEEALARHEGNVTRAARELGLKNRYALYRLMKRYGL